MGARLQDIISLFKHVSVFEAFCALTCSTFTAVKAFLD